MLIDEPDPTRYHGGFAIGTSHEAVIRDNAFDIFYYYPDINEIEKIWLERGLVTSEGEITDAGWNLLNKEIETLERKAVAWLKQAFVGARDEGHGSFDDLIGSLIVDLTDKNQRNWIYDTDGEIIEDPLIYHQYEFPYEIGESFYKGVSDFTASLVDVSVEFFDFPEELDFNDIKQSIVDYHN